MEKFYKYSGINFYEKYILPTNPSSKNPLWKLIMSPIKFACTVNNTRDKLYTRLYSAYVWGGLHVCLMTMDALNSNDLTNTSFITRQLLCNIYPILVQLKVRNRIKKVLGHKKENNIEGSTISKLKSDNENIEI